MRRNLPINSQDSMEYKGCCVDVAESGGASQRERSSVQRNSALPNDDPVQSTNPQASFWFQFGFAVRVALDGDN